MKRPTLLLLLLCLWGGCARVESLNLKNHTFGRVPQKIIWFQVPGLTEEHLAMLRFSNINIQKLTSFEDSACVGKIWNFNLYDLRPRPEQSLMAQMVGKLNIKGNCEDFSQRPIWRSLEEINFSTGILEGEMADGQSLYNAWKCPDGQEFRKNLTLWRMAAAPNKEAPTFHYQNKEFSKGEQVVYDKSCQGETCYASLANNIYFIQANLQKSKSRYLFIVRDFSYYQALSNKNISQARENLSEWEKVFNYFLTQAKDQDDMLILLSSAATQSFEFPSAGKDWGEFEGKGKNILYRRPGLISSVWAFGASAENFCGIYSEAEMYQRLLWQQGKEEKIFKFL